VDSALACLRLDYAILEAFFVQAIGIDSLWSRKPYISTYNV
jgi:hypothetical protein